MCSRDILFYLNAFCWLLEPREAVKLPFITYPFQDDAIAIIQDALGNHDLVIEKSRDMGASWMCLTCIEWLWHFKPDIYTFLLLSRKAELVDGKGKDPKSLFAKLDFLHDNQPKWLMPVTTRMKMQYSNEDTDSSMDGESTNEFAGIADRRYALLIDEFSKMDNQNIIFRGTRDVTNCRIFNFTPEGATNMASRLVLNPKFRKLTLHWSTHPIKAVGLYRVPEDGEVEFIDMDYWTAARQADTSLFRTESPYSDRYKFRSPWYDEHCDRADSTKEIAQELDIDYLGSSFQYFNPSKLNKAMGRTTSPYSRGELEHDKGRPLQFDRGAQGLFHLWIHLDTLGNPPLHNCRYVVGADISAGTGASNSTLCVGDAITHVQIAEYANPNIRPEEFALLAVAVCRWFKNPSGQGADLIWEAPGPGREFGGAVQDLGYGNIYWDFQGRKRRKFPGWTPIKEEKRELIFNYKTAIYEERFHVKSHLQLDECRYYVHRPDGWVEHTGQASPDDPSGARENHGDRPLAGALCWKQMCVLAPSTIGGLVTNLPDVANTPTTPFLAALSSPEWTPADLPIQDAPPGTMMSRRALHVKKRREQEMW